MFNPHTPITYNNMEIIIRPRKTGSTVNFSVRFEKDIYDKIMKIAKQKNVLKSPLINDLLRAVLKEIK